MSKPSAIEQLEAAGVLDASNLHPEVRDRINHETSDETVEHLIKFKQGVDTHTDHPEPKKWTPASDGSIF